LGNKGKTRVICDAVFDAWYTSMESTEAGFITMVMDRLHALEEKNLSLEKQNMQLAARLSTKERQVVFV